ncbi:MAG: tripartite tricarboxylate transporter substrate binding protein [Proteobacteria bacterium]|nr:tripartite tricarboxylate transporter substrate binding protein [Burkholderiales bacterium]
MQVHFNATIVSLATVALGVLNVVDAPIAHGQGDPYPTKPIRFIVPFAAAGVSDIVARTIGARLQESLGQSVLIENRGGAGGTIGADVVAKATPDGYTIGIGNLSTHTIAPSVYRKLPYDPVKDFAPVSMVATAPNVMAVTSTLAVKNLKEVIALSKTRPLSFASSGVGTVFHLAGEMVNTMAGIDMTHVPYKGVAAAYPEVIAGSVPLIFDSIISASGHIKAGRIRPLAITSSARSPVLPDVPTMVEAGLPGFELNFWIGIFAPPATPAPIIARLNGEILKALKTPEVRAQFAAQGADVVGTSPGELLELIRGGLPRMAKLVKAAKIEPE